MNSKAPKKKGFQQIKVSDCIEPEARARMEIDPEEIENLARSIESQGDLQAIEVVERNGKFEIVFGHRRWLAHKLLEKETIWARVVIKTKDEVTLTRATENIARIDLTPVEEGANYQTLKEEFGMTIEKIAKRVGRKASRVKRMLDIVRMPSSFQKAIHKGKISPTVAEALWRCTDESHRDYLLELAVEHGVTATVAAQWVQEHSKDQRQTKDIENRGGGVSSPMEGSPHYMTCDVCHGPEDTSKVKQLILCGECHKKIAGP